MVGIPENLKEVLQRMTNGEKGLHTKVIEPYKLVRTSTIPELLKELVASEIKSKKFVVHKKRKDILILRRPE